MHGNTTKENRLMRWKESFQGKFKHDSPSVFLDITESLVEPYACNCKPPAEKEMITAIQKLKANKTHFSDQNGFLLSFKYCPPPFIIDRPSTKVFSDMEKRNNIR